VENEAVPQAGNQSRGLITDRSGTTAQANVSQQLAAANVNRAYLIIQNLSSAVLWVNFEQPATAGRPSLKVPPDGALSFEGGWVPTGQVNVLGGAAAQDFTAKEA